MCIDQAEATAEPPSSLTTCLITVSVPATSSFVIVQVLLAPGLSVIAPDALQSPLIVAADPLGPSDSLTRYEPAASVLLVPGDSAPGNGLPLTSLPPLLMCIDQAEATAEPPSSLTTCLITVSVPATSSFVIVQVLLAPGLSVIAPDALQSPLIVAAYPLGPSDSLTRYEPAATVLVVPGDSAPGNGLPLTSLPPLLMCIDQAEATAEPPLSLTTCLITVSVGAMSSFVTVHVLFSPGLSVTLPFASQSPAKLTAEPLG